MNDKDRAWSSLDAFFSTRQHSGERFDEFCSRWDRLYVEACTNANLQGERRFKAISSSPRTLCPISRSLRVDGDLNRFREMVTLQSRLSRSQDVITAFRLSASLRSRNAH